MRVVIGMGSNLGRRMDHLQAGLRRLSRAHGVGIRGVSPVYRSAPVGPPQPDFLNAAVALDFEGSPGRLWDELQAIERARGRVRTIRWGPRTLDLDVLDWDLPPGQTSELTVPHPRLLDRPWALAPLLDVSETPDPVREAALQALGGPPPRFRYGALRDPGWGRQAPASGRQGIVASPGGRVR